MIYNSFKVYDLCQYGCVIKPEITNSTNIALYVQQPHVQHLTFMTAVSMLQKNTNSQ